MSRENVEVVRRGLGALSTGDWQGVFETWDPQIAWDFEREAVLSGVYRGREEVRAALLSFMTEWKDFAFEVEDLIAADDGRIVMLVHLTGQGRHDLAAYLRDEAEWRDKRRSNIPMIRGTAPRLARPGRMRGGPRRSRR